MKTLKFSTLIIALFLVGAGLYEASAEEVKKQLQQEFEVNDNTTLVLKNRFGNITINNWDKNQVLIDVTITVEHPDKEDANRMLEFLDVKFKESGNIVEAITEIDEKMRKMKWGNENKRFSIDYVVSMPSNLQLDLANKYGNVIIDELTGLAKIELKYGKLKANKILRGADDPKSEVTLAYAKGSSIEMVKWLKVNMKYSGLTIDQGEVLGLYSRYSELNADALKSLVFDSKYDVYRIDRIAVLKGEGGYTTYSVDHLEKKLDISTNYGKCVIDEVGPDFTEIKFDASYCKLEATIDPAASYNIEAEASYGKIDVPDSGKLSRIKQSNTMTISGTVGKNANPKASVKAKTKYGSIILR